MKTWVIVLFVDNGLYESEYQAEKESSFQKGKKRPRVRR